MIWTKKFTSDFSYHSLHQNRWFLRTWKQESSEDPLFPHQNGPGKHPKVVDPKNVGRIRKTYHYTGGPFSRGPFCTVFASSKKQKRETHGFQKKKWRKFRILSFQFGSFFYKNFSTQKYFLFLFVLSNFRCFNPWGKFGLFKAELFFLYCERLRKDILIKFDKYDKQVIVRTRWPDAWHETILLWHLILIGQLF